MKNITSARTLQIARVAGFTLLELLTAISIATLLIALALPSLRQFQISSALKTHVGRVFQIAQASRENALDQAANIVVCGTTNLTNCTRSGFRTLMIFADTNNSGIRESSEPVIWQYDAPTQFLLYIATPPQTNKNWLSYRAIGDANPWGSIYLCSTAKDLGGFGHQVIISRIGRNRILTDGPKVLEECRQRIMNI
jgi:prepilin-type N-terminal cleavage/methylation domain-containing protein